MTAVPVLEDDLTGRRKTKLKGLSTNAEEIIIEDDCKESDDPHRALQDCWRGETWLEPKAESRDAKNVNESRRVKPEHKRKADMKELPSRKELEKEEEADLQPSDLGEEQQQEPLDFGSQSQPSQLAEGALFPRVPGISRPQRQRSRVPARANFAGPQCPVDACQLPGGHSGPREDEDGQQFTWEERRGRLNLDDDKTSNASDSPEELLIAEPANKIYNSQVQPQLQSEKPAPCFYALEIDVLPSDTKYLTSKPENVGIWLSKKMQGKGKEKR